MFSLFFKTADLVSRPAKVRGTFLPQEYILSQFISHIVTSEESWTVETSACEWKYVKCNSKKEVTHLYWSSSIFDSECPTIEGELLWKFIPHTLLYLGTFWQSITGTVELSLLPPHMEEIHVGSTKCHGSLELTNLPSTLKVMDLQENNLTGQIDLTSLPALIREINLSFNYLRGTVDLTKLPESLKELDLSYNRFKVSEYVPDVVNIEHQEV